jgi:uncharacterized membrane protein YhaH (DUF805 family)
MIEYYKKVVFENYSNFSGRARRSEYWYFVLANLLIMVSMLILCSILTAITGSGAVMIVFVVLCGLYFLFTFIPTLAVAVRRLHDTGKSGWYYFVQMIPVIGGIWMLALLCTDGDPGINQYGADPKNNYIDIDEIGTE